MNIAQYNDTHWGVSFPYNEGLLNIMRLCAGRRWVKSKKTWAVSKCLPNYRILEPYIVQIDHTVHNDLEELRRFENGTVFTSRRLKIPEFYQFKTPQYAHQKEDTEIMLNVPYYGYFNEMGTGKSKVLIDTAGILYHYKELTSVVIVCPNTVKSSWGDPNNGQIATHCSEDCTATIVHSGKLKQVESLYGPGLIFVVVNYEALRSQKMRAIFTQFFQALKPWLILDESTAIKDPSSLQTKACMELAKLSSRRTIVTGTPIANNPGDFYSQFKFLNERILQYPTFGAYKDHYLIQHVISGNRKIPIRWKNLDELDNRLRPFYTRRLKSECLDLPEKVFIKEAIPLSKDQAHAYSEIKNNLVLESNQGDVSVNNILTKLLRLQQITAGFVTSDSGKILQFPNPKFDEVVARTRLIQKPTLIFCRFLHEIHQLSESFKGANITNATIYGDVPTDSRQQYIDLFQAGELPVLICQIETGGIGITLTRAEYVFYTTNTFSYKSRSQSEDRAHRAGLQHKVTYFDFLSTCHGAQTVDHLVYKALSKKKNVADLILDRKDWLQEI